MLGTAPDPKVDRAPDVPPGLPRWVKLLVLGALIVVIVLMVVMLLVGGEHGPAMHGG